MLARWLGRSILCDRTDATHHTILDVWALLPRREKVKFLKVFVWWPLLQIWEVFFGWNELGSQYSIDIMCTPVEGLPIDDPSEYIYNDSQISMGPFQAVGNQLKLYKTGF